VVRVTDNGPGVPADVLPRIFEPFFTTKPKGQGTGLGLGIARQIVHKHGGTMRCESRPAAEAAAEADATAGASAGASAGTTFEVRLPIATTASIAGVASIAGIE